ncbi:MAG: hypothetical protein ACRDQ2_09585 [Gaiellales bacterium]
MLPSTERPAVAWRTLSLKEFRRPPSEPSLFERDGEGLGSLSIPALALAHAAREADFDGYHEAVFDPVGAAHLPRRPPRACCPARPASTSHQADSSRWLEAVAAEHRGVERWQAARNADAALRRRPRAVYVRMQSAPDHARERWDLIDSFSVGPPGDARDQAQRVSMLKTG